MTLTTKITRNISLLIIASVLFYVATKPYPGVSIKPKTLTKTETIKFIYRGVPVGHPGYGNALSGIAKPFGGPATPMMHQDGQTNSNYTSWTTDIMIAYKYATNGVYGPCDGVILVKKIDVSENRFIDVKDLQSGDTYGECEIMVKGMINGAAPMKVTPGMSSNAILQLMRTL